MMGRVSNEAGFAVGCRILTYPAFAGAAIGNDKAEP
jgi:hypothetical protein